MISLQRSMHSSQMYTPGPAINFFTWRWDFPQKLQRSCSFESVGLATLLSLGARVAHLKIRGESQSPFWTHCFRPAGRPELVLRDHAVDDLVLSCLIRAHEVIALGVLRDLLEVLLGVLGEDLVEAPAHVDDLLRVDLDVGGLSLEGRTHLVDQDLRVGQ